MGSTQTTDVLVIGAGPAGCMAGATLVKEGFSVLCLERSYFPRHVIGESLLPRANELLQHVGLLEPVDERQFMPKHGALFLRGTERERFCFAEALKGDFPSSYQVPRADFDQTLALATQTMGVDLRFGHTVTSVAFEEEKAIVEVEEQASQQSFSVYARFVLDCSGYGRVLPRLLGLEQPSSLPPRLACFSQWEGDQRPEGSEEGDIWVCVHPVNGWIWHIPFSNGRTSVGAVCDPEHWGSYEGSPEQKLRRYLLEEPNTRERLEGAESVWSAREIRGYSTKVTQWYGERWALAGNAGDFLDPVFSSGVTLALETAHRAATLAGQVLHGDPVDWERDYKQVIAKATEVFRAFVTSWYSRELESIFFSEFKLPRMKRRITSILGGYVLREDNPLTASPSHSLHQLYSFLPAS
ncbi:MAG: NAD(P)/FAD-dependent oxidoreductase [Deltaproteobacteria bacterium]|nr:MAG: NAD(P)/FAD-dependent oxidoreductase [Deltaproteobacteria bacterium]